MANLIEQMDILKGLNDAQLHAELSNPTGGAAPYLVASEVARRKDMRQRYADEVARRKPNTTVIDDLMGGAQPSGGMPSAMPTPPDAGGIAAAVPPAGPQGFASGGVVAPGIAAAVPAPVDYSAIAQKYQSQLDGLPSDRNRAAALALIAAGAGIMGGGHSNTLQNVGLGVDAGLTSYQDQLKTVTAQQAQDLAGLTDIGRLQRAQQSDEADRALREKEMAQNAIPASAREFDYYSSLTPAQQQQYLTLNQPYAAQTAANTQDEVAATGQGIVDGTIDPRMKGMYRQTPAITAWIAKNHPEVNLLQAQQEANAADRNISSLNGPGQTRLKQAIDTVIGPDGEGGQLGELQDIAQQWKGGGFPALNRANLILAKNGALGEKAMEIATQFDSQLSETTTELASIFRGGNSPTDSSLQHADKFFDQDTSAEAFDKLIALAKRNIAYRRAALDQKANGVRQDSPYLPQNQNGPVPAANGTTSTNIPFTVEP